MNLNCGTSGESTVCVHRPAQVMEMRCCNHQIDSGRRWVHWISLRIAISVDDAVDSMNCSVNFSVEAILTSHFLIKIYNYYYSEFVRAPPTRRCDAEGKMRRWTMGIYYYELSTQTRGRRPQAIEFVDPNPTHTHTPLLPRHFHCLTRRPSINFSHTEQQAIFLSSSCIFSSIFLL